MDETHVEPRLAAILVADIAGYSRLMAEDEVFRRAVEEIDALVRATAGWSIIEELKAPREASQLADTRFAQPMLFAIHACSRPRSRRRSWPARPW